MQRELPSGEQYEIRFGDQHAIVVEVGAALREYTVASRPIVDGFNADAMADGSRGQPLLPWPNRIVDGQYEFDGQTLQLPIEEVSRHNAIHGLTRWANWTLAGRADNRVTLEHTIHPRTGYPFALQLTVQYELGSAGLEVRTTARNVGSNALPFGAGQHPYLTVGTELVDEATLTLRAGCRLELDADRRVPTGAELATAGTRYDFAQLCPIGDLVLDDCFADLERDGTGVAHVTMQGERRVTLWMDASYKYVQVFTGDTLVEPRRRRGLAVEPLTCPPNAFRTGQDLIVLEPEQEAVLNWGLTAF